MLKFLAINEFNRVDFYGVAAMCGLVGGGLYWSALVVFVIGCPLSIFVTRKYRKTKAG